MPLKNNNFFTTKFNINDIILLLAYYLSKLRSFECLNEKINYCLCFNQKFKGVFLLTSLHNSTYIHI